MKIYFDGCSWTLGGELVKNNRQWYDEEELKIVHSLRFSRLLSNKLDAEDHNFSRGGASNDRIVRQLLVENDITQYDLAIIQMTYPTRTEYHDKKWKGVSSQDIRSSLLKKSRRDWTEEDRNFWSHYYSKIYDDCYHDVKEKIHATTIRNHCKANNVPLILMTINNCQTKLKFDLDLDLDKYPREKGGHPNAEGHIMIANDILTSYENIL